MVLNYLSVLGNLDAEMLDDDSSKDDVASRELAEFQR
jgi:hypothetical protein